MWCGVNYLSLWILCYMCFLGKTDKVNDNEEEEKIINIPLRQKRTTDGGQLSPLPMTQQSGSVPSGRSGQASYDYQHGGASYDTSGSHQTNSGGNPGEDDIRTTMVFNTANYDIHAEVGRSTYTPNTNAYPATRRNQGTQTGDGSRTTVTQYYVTRDGTAQRLGTTEELGNRNNNNAGSQQYDSRTSTGGQTSHTQTSHRQTSQRHGQTTQGSQGNDHYSTSSRTYPGRRQTPVYNTNTQQSGVHTSNSRTQTYPYQTGNPTHTSTSSQTHYPTNTGTSYTTETRTTQTHAYYPYQTGGTTYTTRTRPRHGYSRLGQVLNVNNRGRHGRRPYNRGGYITGTSSVPNTGVISNDPNCPAESFRVYINNMECAQAVDTLGSFICYNYERVSRECCEKCLSVKRSNNVGCEYGDRSYQCRNMEPFDCYSERNREICCDTCGRYESQQNTGIPNCWYGDLTPRCQIVSERSHLCYLPENQRLCCLTCPRLEDRSNPSCKWGDQNPELCEPFTDDNRLRLNCYQHSVQQVCCSSCERLRSRIPVNIPGCQYGDHPVQMNTPHGLLSCRSYVRQYGIEVCETETINTHCCYTCYQYRQLQRG